MGPRRPSSANAVAIAASVLVVCAASTAKTAAQFIGEAVREDTLLEELRRDDWSGRPTSEELGSAPPGTNALELTKDRGWLYSRRVYYDFTLDYEMRLLPGGRHRLYFRTLGRDHASYELRIEAGRERLKGELLSIRAGARNDRAAIPQDRVTTAFAGREWHTIRVQAEGARAIVSANGTTLLVVDGLHNLGGRIGFAGQGVTYRTARVRSPHARQEAFRAAYDSSLVENLEMPELVKEVRPVMPNKAYTSPVDYRVILEVVIDERGNVVAERFVQRLDENLGYTEEAVRAVRQWKFKPARLEGKPVPVAVTIELTFTWAAPRR